MKRIAKLTMVSAAPLSAALLCAACAGPQPARIEPAFVELPRETVTVAWRPPPSASEVEASVDDASTAISAAFSAGEDRAAGWRTLPEDRGWQMILEREGVEKMRLSVGTTASGYLQNSVRLAADGEAHQIIERHRRYVTGFGTGELVSAIEQAGVDVAEAYPGSILRVGNLSRRNGGDIRWSHSHNSGRDADLAFYVHRVDTGEAVPAPDLMHFGPNGLAQEDPNYAFDVPRNWALVRSLLTNEDVTVQWLFVSIPLKEMLLSHARLEGEPEELIAQASEVLHQPTDALPHDDHFHLRIACPREDRLEGCIDWGPRWEWADWHDDALKARSLEIAKVFEEETDSETRLKALQFLEEIKSPFRAEVALVWGVWDRDPVVRAEALELADRAWPWSAVAIVSAERFIVADSTNLGEKAEAYSILRRAMDPLGWEFAKSRIRDPNVDPSEKVYAARSLEHAMNADLVPFLLEQLETQAAPVRVELASVLMRLTNHTETADWRTGSEEERRDALSAWRQWWDANRDSPRELWVLAGFKRLGVDVDGEMTVRSVDRLLPLLRKSPEHVVYNVNRIVREITGRWAPLEQVDGVLLYKYWMKWWRDNRARVLSDS